MEKNVLDHYSAAINLCNEQLTLLSKLQAKLNDIGFLLNVVKDEDTERVTEIEKPLGDYTLEVKLNPEFMAEVNGAQSLITVINENRDRIPVYNSKCCLPIKNKLTVCSENDSGIEKKKKKNKKKCDKEKCDLQPDNNPCICKSTCDKNLLGTPLGEQIIYYYLTNPSLKCVENQVETWVKVCIPKLAEFTGYFLFQKTFPEYQPLYDYYKNLVYQIYQNYVRETEKLNVLISFTKRQRETRNREIDTAINSFIKVCENELLFTKKMGQYWYSKTDKTSIPQWLT